MAFGESRAVHLHNRPPRDRLGLPMRGDPIAPGRVRTLPPRHYDRTRGKNNGNSMYLHGWSTNKGYVHNTTHLCPLVERCGCPCEAKIEESPEQFIIYIHKEYTAADHKDDRRTIQDIFPSTNKIPLGVAPLGLPLRGRGSQVAR